MPTGLLPQNLLLLLAQPGPRPSPRLCRVLSVEPGLSVCLLNEGMKMGQGGRQGVLRGIEGIKASERNKRQAGERRKPMSANASYVHSVESEFAGGQCTMVANILHLAWL